MLQALRGSICGFLLLSFLGMATAQDLLHAGIGRRIADTVLKQHPTHPPAVLLNGLDAEWYNTADGRYERYIQSVVNAEITDGKSPSAIASQILLVYRITQKPAYYQIAFHLYRQMLPQEHLTAREAYLADPFLAEYAAVFRRDHDFATIAAHIQQTDPKADLRDLGFRLMAMASTLPYFPQGIAGRTAAVAAFQQLAALMAHRQDLATGLWRDDLEAGSLGRSSLDPIGSAEVTFSLARGVRLGLLPRRYAAVAERAWKGILRSVPLKMTKASGNSAGILLLAANEMRLYPNAEMGLGSRALVDGWYNNEERKNAAGEMVPFHYKWDDYSNPGYSFLGHIFRSYGVSTDTIDAAPTTANLRSARFYMIVSPDDRAKVPDPHIITAEQAEQVSAWVKRGGVLILMANDRDNTDIPHMDILADRFGLHFNNVLVHHVIGDDFGMGRIEDDQTGPPFFHPRLIYMKDTCSLKLSKGARPLLAWKGDVLMAEASYGRGTVVAVADPWLYNEYTDGRKLPPIYQNFEAGKEFVRWLLQQK